MLVRLWAQGGTLNSVAAAITKTGFEVTRGAVSGRRMRLGLARPRNFTRPPRAKKVKMVPPQYKKGGIHYVPPKPKEKPRTGEVEYLDLPADGCKAVLDKRGQYGLRMCCGKLRALTGTGNLSPYCDQHTEAYRSPPPTKKAPHGESSEVRKY